ncbi:MAG: endonuclease/exonuclease/phosphatase family protein [Clostridia bacterium]|nr:endonuclease/exonuclease/phosphatase family protein [Clostridia bacterium]
MKNLKIATFNISGGFYIGDESTEYLDRPPAERFDDKMLNEIIANINKEDLDIVCFQEIITTKEVAYIEKIASKTNLKHFESFEIHDCNLVKNTRNGVAIMSKYPITKTYTGFFPNPLLQKTTASGKTYNLFNKGYMISEIDLGDKKITILNHHGFPFRRFNSCAKNNLEVFNHFNNVIKMYEPSFVTGDFNTEDFTELVEEFDIRYKKVTEEETTVDGKKFDNILVPKNIEFNTTILKLLSDHYLLIATIKNV